MVSQNVTYELLELEIFSTLDTSSWADTFACIFTYVFVTCFLALTLLAPLAFFLILFILK